MIELTDIDKHYTMGGGTITALDHVSLVIPEQQFVVVLGPSGSGKTTLLNIIGAIDTPTAGRVVVSDSDISQASRRQLFAYRRSTVSFVFQTFNLFPGLTAAENVQFGADVAGHADAGKAADQALDKVGLADRAGHFPHELSGGQQQRVAVARAIASANPVLLADEPTGELDSNTGVEILRLLLEQSEAGKTVVVVTHNRELARVADRVIEFRDGRVVADGPPAGDKVAITELQW